MTKPTIQTLKELKESSYQSKSIQQELAENLKKKISKGQNAFEGIHGYDHTVIPNLERAILSGHHINLMGLRGQAKTRLARGMTNLLDEWMPIIKGSELNDDPLSPITIEGNNIIDHKNDQTPIDWLHRSERFFEKLATPDVTIADLIGDIDPIKASQLKLTYADQRVIHFGMIPRAHRCIFALNE
ncbi:MAG: magnesium chelatase, partial [Flavobacteriaceae bacterium]|nr:magnesium chelatase [Flavobacteriaceae bacterium]